MAEMVCSALVQETVSRGVSFVLGKREEKASQGHLMEKLEMEVNRLEFALERAQYLPISHLSLISRGKMIESAYVEAMKLLNKQQQAVPPAPGQELQVAAQGVKRKRWFFWDKDMPIIKPSDVRRFQSYADYADKFVRDVQSGCSLYHYNFCINRRIVSHLLEGKALVYSHWEPGNLQRIVAMYPMDCDERGGREAAVSYHYLHYDDSTMTEKSFSLGLFLRLSESTDIAGVAMKGLQLLTSEFKLAAESASGELTMLYTSQDIAHSYWPRCVVKDLWVDIQHSYWPPYVVKDLCVDIQEAHSKHAQLFRPDPACCKGIRLGLCASNNVSSELLSDIFPEQVLFGGFHCYYYVPPPLEAEPSSRSSSSSPPLLLTADFQFMPHRATETQESYAVETIGDVEEYRYAISIQQVVEAIKSNAINCFLRQPELTRYGIDWYSKHGFAGFWVKKESMERSIPEELQGE